MTKAHNNFLFAAPAKPEMDFKCFIRGVCFMSDGNLYTGWDYDNYGEIQFFQGRWIMWCLQHRHKFQLNWKPTANNRRSTTDLFQKFCNLSTSKTEPTLEEEKSKTAPIPDAYYYLHDETLEEKSKEYWDTIT
jgi:hypothetical protein